MNTPHLSINADRFKADFLDLAGIGATETGGINRPTFSLAHLEARQWFKRKCQEAGLEFRVDAAGNHSAILKCDHPSAPTLLLGSHLDSVPDGGRFDGALGVTAALEVLRAIRDADLQLPVHLEAIDFTDEEGTLVGLLGSAALTGHLSAEDLDRPRGGKEALAAGLERAGLHESTLLTAARPPNSLAGYLELHIEQGPRLVNSGKAIGIVSAIVGIISYRLVFIGRADHAGTTPMEDRLDAGQGAAEFILQAQRLALSGFPGCTVTTGIIRFEPGAFNIVPARAEVALEFRSADPDVLDQLETALSDLASSQARRLGLELEAAHLGKDLPAAMNPAVQETIHEVCAALNLSSMPLVSGAGHDAQMMAAFCPSGMIFIPSVGGASHSPREFSNWQDCVNGANVLLQTALRFSRV